MVLSSAPVQQLVDLCRTTVTELFTSLRPDLAPRDAYRQLLALTYRAVVIQIECAQSVPSITHAVDRWHHCHLWSPEHVAALDLSKLPDGLPRLQREPSPNWGVITGSDLAHAHPRLLALEPKIVAGRLHLQQVHAAQRRTLGSYYTPPVLVERLVDEVLDPLITDIIKASNDLAQQRNQLLALRICDPACGAGALLIAAANKLTAAVASTGTPKQLAWYRQQVVSRCLYGVDLDPLALSIAQACTWLNAEVGIPTEHLRVGNALLTAPTGPLSPPPIEHLPGDPKGAVAKLRKLWRGSAKKHVEATMSASNLWVATSFWPHEQAPALTPTLWYQMATNAEAEGQAWVRTLAEQHQFFHWHLGFKKVFAERAGFDAILGNPPWERLKFQEKEFLATSGQRPVSTVAARRQQLRDLETDEAFRDQLAHVRRYHAGLIASIRHNPLFRHSSKGDLNAYSLFVELGWQLLNANGRLGMLVPSGILTESTTARLRISLLDRGAIVAGYEFENLEGMFPGVDRRMRFCLLLLAAHERSRHNASRTDVHDVAVRDVHSTPRAATFHGPRPQQENNLVRRARERAPEHTSTYVFRARSVQELDDPNRRIELTAEDICRQNPTTYTIPVLLERTDAEVSQKLHKLLPYPATSQQSWGLKMTRIFDMTRDAEIFCTRKQLLDNGARRHETATGQLLYDRAGELWVPVVEGKMVDMLDHRAADIEVHPDNQHRPQQPHPLSDEAKRNPAREAQAFLWCRAAEVRKRSLSWNRSWLAVAKRVTSVTNSRTLRVAVIPWGDVALSYTLYALTCSPKHEARAPYLVACMCNLVTDYLVRQKTTQSSLTVGVLGRTPALHPEDWSRRCPWDRSRTMAEWARPKLIELVYTAHATKSFARELDGPVNGPHAWDPRRHAELLADLDAGIMAYLGLSTVEVRHILKAFPALHRRDQRQFGEQLTANHVQALHERRQGGTNPGKTS